MDLDELPRVQTSATGMHLDRHVLEESSGMDTDGHENWFAPNQFTKEANQQGVSL